jgi:alpha-beta hydrolase superfamily lysophospholipase
MTADTFKMTAPDGTDVHCCRWLPAEPKATVQIVHGGAEHAGRYARLDGALVESGYGVYAEDHRGHGHTAASLGDMGPPNGFENTCDDVTRLGTHAKEAHPGLPLVILGHSIGSLITQRVITGAGETYRAVALSGSPSVDVLTNASVLVDDAIAANGRNAPGDELQMQIFASFLEGLGEIRTPFDWLSRDPVEVDKYIADPMCGFALNVGAWRDIIDGALPTTDAELVRQIPQDLPVYIFSGDADPVHDNGGAIAQLSDRYEAAGLQNVRVRLYEGGRHEMFNETNRAEVTDELLAWLDSVV